MADEEHLAYLKDSITEDNGCASWNQWRSNSRDIKINLKGADLHGADLRNADFTCTDLRDANFYGAKLRDANLYSANLSNAVLYNADLYFADLSSAYLRNANLSGAKLRNASLIGSDLTSADLRNADLTGAKLRGVQVTGMKIGWTVIGDLDLHGIRGLETIQHEGPSTIGSDTFYKSHGDIPDVFLRGCGVPDEMIGFVHAIAGAIQYYSAFISYNHEDEIFATRIYNDLQANNVRCWKYTEDMKIGDPIQARVDQAIRLHDKLLVIFSAQSVHSDWVADEVERAMKREDQEQKTILFPVKIDNAINQVDYGWAKHVRRDRNIGDFTAWKDQD